MRTIKFRGKRVDNGEWVYGNLLLFGSVYEIMPQVGIGPIVSRRVQRKTVGQFTGLLDKDGNEIYEGDVIGGYPHGSAYVVYNDNWGCFESRSINAKLEEVNGLFANDLKDCFNEWSVIGNIHDNPELINQ